VVRCVAFVACTYTLTSIALLIYVYSSQHTQNLIQRVWPISCKVGSVSSAFLKTGISQFIVEKYKLL
jgi:hypothetical protein